MQSKTYTRMNAIMHGLDQAWDFSHRQIITATWAILTFLWLFITQFQLMFTFGWLGYVMFVGLLLLGTLCSFEPIAWFYKGYQEMKTRIT